MVLTEQTVTYDSWYPEPGLTNRLPGMGRNICQLRPDVILFAGRSPELAEFVESLARRNCRQDLPITILAGADTVELSRAARSNPGLLNGLKAGVSVNYTTQAIQIPRNIHRAACTTPPSWFPGRSVDCGVRKAVETSAGPAPDVRTGRGGEGATL